MGIDHHSAVTKTEIGVIWTNKRGCYVYDGKQIKNLIDNKINVRIWSSFITESGMVGYLPDKKQIIITKSPFSINGSCYIYDFITGSWTFGESILSSVRKSNFVNDRFGQLIWGEYATGSSAGEVYVATNSATTTSNVDSYSQLLQLFV